MVIRFKEAKGKNLNLIRFLEKAIDIYLKWLTWSWFIFLWSEALPHREGLLLLVMQFVELLWQSTRADSSSRWGTLWLSWELSVLEAFFPWLWWVAYLTGLNAKHLGDPLLRQSTTSYMKEWKIISLIRPRKLKRTHKDLAGKDHTKAIVLLSFSHPFPLLTFFFMGPNNLINYKCKNGFFWSRNY